MTNKKSSKFEKDGLLKKTRKEWKFTSFGIAVVQLLHGIGDTPEKIAQLFPEVGPEVIVSHCAEPMSPKIKKLVRIFKGLCSKKV
ncbi:MAG: hypothetical protein CEN90_89 [Parcubacteria group bacterium Licking1014_17]|nr:MAG: hypothetical protein CEN90_89 [Parcubacteria group bacterium Licking1014_17]